MAQCFYYFKKGLPHCRVTERDGYEEEGIFIHQSLPDALDLQGWVRQSPGTWNCTWSPASVAGGQHLGHRHPLRQASAGLGLQGSLGHGVPHSS